MVVERDFSGIGDLEASLTHVATIHPVTLNVSSVRDLLMRET